MYHYEYEDDQFVLKDGEDELDRFPVFAMIVSVTQGKITLHKHGSQDYVYQEFKKMNRMYQEGGRSGRSSPGVANG